MLFFGIGPDLTSSETARALTRNPSRTEGLTDSLEPQASHVGIALEDCAVCIVQAFVEVPKPPVLTPRAFRVSEFWGLTRVSEVGNDRNL